MKACLLLGSNLGDRKEHLAKALMCIERDIGTVVLVSQIYETEPWGFEADTLFLNQALLIDTILPPLHLLECCHHIETELGRRKAEPARTTGTSEGTETNKVYASRTIDIDILFYEEVVCETPELTLPHPRLHQRTFALVPLAEVAPEWRHPVLGLTAEDLLASLERKNMIFGNDKKM